MKHKIVELTELFYDLVYVYAISQITSLIHHLHHGFVAPSQFLSFGMGLIIFINSWMVQTVFTNRFGNNTFTDILFMFGQMFLLMVSATNMGGLGEISFVWVVLPMAGISGLLLFQYALAFYRTGNLANRDFIKRYFYILGVRTPFLPYRSFFPTKLVYH